jgi:glucokinase
MSYARRFISLDDARRPLFVGVDLGGTNIKAGVVDDLGRPLSWCTRPTDARRGAEDGARRIGEAILSAIEQARLEPSDIACVGLGAPGTMDIPAGMLLDPPNLPGWIDFPLRDRVSQHCGLPVVFDNDASAAAYGEFWIGTGSELKSIVMLTLGTGIGGGIIVDDSPLNGEHSHGSECGHIIIDWRDDARVCQCGRTGHLEAYAGANAVVKRTQEALAAGRPSSLVKLIAGGEKLTPELIAREAEAGDELATSIILETAWYLAVGVVSLMHALDPDGVIIGGAMNFGMNSTAIGRKFMDVLRREVQRRAFPVPAQLTKIDYASLGGDAGFLGAAGLAQRAWHKSAGHAEVGHNLTVKTA